MNTLKSPSQLATIELNKLGLEDLTTYSKEEEKEFWKEIEAKYDNQFK